MNDNSLKKLNRKALLEILLEQAKRIEELEDELAETKEMLNDRNVKLSNVGSLAEASLVLSDIFKAADEAIAIQMQNIENIKLEEEKRVKKELRALKKKKTAEIDKKIKKDKEKKEVKSQNDEKQDVIPEVKEEKKKEPQKKPKSTAKRKVRK